jgi:hypothetical protein
MLDTGFDETNEKDGFQHWEGDCLWHLYCAFRMEKNRDEGWIDVTVSVGFRSLDEFLQKCPELGGIDPKQPCAMATDTGGLRGGPPYQAVQWRILRDTNPDTIGPEVVEEIRNYALRYFQEFGSLEKCLDAWEHRIFYNTDAFHGDAYLAAAYWLKGEKDRALNHVRKRLDDRREFYRKEGRHSTLLTIGEYERFLKFLENEYAMDHAIRRHL